MVFNHYCCFKNCMFMIEIRVLLTLIRIKCDCNLKSLPNTYEPQIVFWMVHHNFVFQLYPCWSFSFQLVMEISLAIITKVFTYPSMNSNCNGYWIWPHPRKRKRKSGEGTRNQRETGAWHIDIFICTWCCG